MYFLQRHPISPWFSAILLSLCLMGTSGCVERSASSGNGSEGTDAGNGESQNDPAPEDETPSDDTTGTGSAIQFTPLTEDQCFDSDNSRIHCLPAHLVYESDAPDYYPRHIGYLSHLALPVGECNQIDNLFTQGANGLRCGFTATYEDSANPAIGGDPYGRGQTYLGPGGLALSNDIGPVTALSVGWMWQFGEGWIEAIRAGDEHRDETPWADWNGDDRDFSDTQVGGYDAKPIILRREQCEWWFDVRETISDGSQASVSGILPGNGIVRDSLEIIVSDTEYLYHVDDELRTSEGGSTVGSINRATGEYDFTLPMAPGAPIVAYYRTEPPAGDPSQPRYQSQGEWRDSLVRNDCRERPMVRMEPIHVMNGATGTVQPAITLTASDDISCACFDYRDGQCHGHLDDPSDDSYTQFRIGASSHDNTELGLVHVGVDEPLYLEFLVDLYRDRLELRASTPDGRYNNTVISSTSFCDSADNAAIRYNGNPHRYGRFITLGEPFWKLPMSTIPTDTWHQVGQWSISGAVNGEALSPQGPPQGFVAEN